MNSNDFRTQAPAITEFPVLGIPSIAETVTTGGNRLIVLDNGDQPVNKLTLSYAGGIVDSSNQAATILMTQLLREGTLNLSGEEISEKLDFNGAWLKIEPSAHYITASLYSMNSSAKELYGLLDEIVNSPSFPEKEFESIKEKMASSAAINMKKVSFLSSKTDKELTFGKGHPMTRQSPSADDYRNVTRKDIIESWNHFIAGATPTIYLAGQVDSLVKDVADRFGNNTGPNDDLNKINIVKPAVSVNRRRDVIVEDALQCGITMTVPTIDRYHPDYIDLRFAVMALGGYFGSRLMSVIREEKGYTYGISASLLGYLEGGFMTISTQTDPRYRDALISETTAEIEKMRNNLMESDEFSRIRQYVMSSLASILDSPFNIIEHYQNIDHNRIAPGYFERQQESLRRLTPERIQEVMNRHIDTDGMRISVAGPLQ